ncbi:hypothetical protein C8A05DRAFT_29329 [Staphylotrichum tortipilum]|uniref:Uncharacterized protein n=1 Tax=Staphylotrichum tortipilum TaxID=2831512 RepID=A0AAN6RY64_9PEZI|nr:hypothetical protein C8A05DRAFT_29329 [Staphylotrichum longicolle]
MIPLHRAFARALLFPRFFQPPIVQAALLHDHLLTGNESKWGWVVYRTAYANPPSADPFTPGITSYQTWALLQAHVTARARSALAREEEDDPAAARHLRNAMDWVFVEDRAALEGASREELRGRFRARREGAMREEIGEAPAEVGGDGGVPWKIPSAWYQFFLVVDEEAMASIAEGEGGPLDGNWVNLVRCDEEMEEAEEWERERSLGRGLMEKGWAEDGEGGEEGKEDEWRMRLAVHLVTHEFYYKIGGILENWYVYYQEPPEVLWY